MIRSCNLIIFQLELYSWIVCWCVFFLLLQVSPIVYLFCIWMIIMLKNKWIFCNVHLVFDFVDVLCCCVVAMNQFTYNFFLKNVWVDIIDMYIFTAACRKEKNSLPNDLKTMDDYYTLERLCLNPEKTVTSRQQNTER